MQCQGAHLCNSFEAEQHTIQRPYIARRTYAEQPQVPSVAPSRMFRPRATWSQEFWSDTKNAEIHKLESQDVYTDVTKSSDQSGFVGGCIDCIDCIQSGTGVRTQESRSSLPYRRIEAENRPSPVQLLFSSGLPSPSSSDIPYNTWLPSLENCSFERFQHVADLSTLRLYSPTTLFMSATFPRR